MITILSIGGDFNIAIYRFEAKWKPDRGKNVYEQMILQKGRLLEALYELFQTKLCDTDDYIMRFSIGKDKLYAGGSYGYMTKEGIAYVVSQLVTNAIFVVERNTCMILQLDRDNHLQLPQ